MTAREVYEGVLIELEAEDAPEMQLDSFNYYINKGIYNYVNKRYNLYNTNQQTTDDLQVLKSPHSFTGNELILKGDKTTYSNGNYITEAVYNMQLPSNYYHLLNCLVTYELGSNFKGYKKDSMVQFAAKKINSESYANIINNAFLRPTYNRPYFNVLNDYNQIKGDWINAQDKYNSDVVRSFIDKKAGDTKAHNAFYDENHDGTLNNEDTFVGPILQINYGRDNSIFQLVRVDIDYLRVPSRIVLTAEQLDQTVDYSQIMEFPEYVCQQIIHEIVLLVMAKDGSPKINLVASADTSIPNNIAAPQEKRR